MTIGELKKLEVNEELVSFDLQHDINANCITMDIEIITVFPDGTFRLWKLMTFNENQHYDMSDNEVHYKLLERCDADMVESKLPGIFDYISNTPMNEVSLKKYVEENGIANK